MRCRPPARKLPRNVGRSTAWSAARRCPRPRGPARAALAVMKVDSAARIVLMTSEAGWASTPGFGPYNISKAALNSLGTSLAAESAQRFPGYDIQINVLVPGEART